jgi:hypothetical protein
MVLPCADCSRDGIARSLIKLWLRATACLTQVAKHDVRWPLSIVGYLKARQAAYHCDS